METTFIYALCEPKSDNIRYIGKSDNPKMRLSRHISTAKANKSMYYLGNWIRKILEKELKPQLLVIKEVPKSEWEYWEKYYIKFYKDAGNKLCNLHEGGNGNPENHNHSTIELIKIKRYNNLVLQGKIKISYEEYQEQLLVEKNRVKNNDVKPVIMLDKFNNFIKEFPSVRACWQEMGFNRKRVEEMLVGYRYDTKAPVYSYKGYVIVYKSKYNPNKDYTVKHKCKYNTKQY